MTPDPIAPIDCAYSVDGEGAPLVLIHGIGASRNAWVKALPVLTPHFTVITYDLRGHGDSPLPQGEFGLDELVADLEHIRLKTGYEQLYVAGHSLGGMIAPAYARAYPERVKGLGLLSTAAFRTEDDKAKVQAVIDAMHARGIADVLPTLTDRWFTDRFIAESPDIVKARLDQVLKTNADVFLNVFQIYASTEMAAWLDKITAPSLILTGEFDGGCNPRLNQAIHAAMPESSLVILPELKHSLLLEAGDVVAEHVRDFIFGLGDKGQ